MLGPGRVRAGLKWALTASALVLTAAWLASLCVLASRTYAAPGGTRQYIVAVGAFIYTETPPQAVSYIRRPAPVTWQFRAQPPIWSRLVLLPSIDTSPGGGFSTVVVPLWMPTALSVIPGLVMWRADRRLARLGQCPSCRYSLTGLPEGAACPECGAEAVVA